MRIGTLSSRAFATKPGKAWSIHSSRRCSSSSARLICSSSTWPAMHSREPMRPARQSCSSTSQPGRPKRSSSESITSSTEIVPSKSHRMVQPETGISGALTALMGGTLGKLPFGALSPPTAPRHGPNRG